MRVFEKDGNVLKTNDEIIAKALINSGYIEKQEIVIESTPKKSKKRSIDED